jgi:hypothetical protein
VLWVGGGQHGCDLLHASNELSQGGLMPADSNVALRILVMGRDAVVKQIKRAEARS